MIAWFRRKLGLPLLTGHELQCLNGCWWASIGAFGRLHNRELKDRMAHSELINEFMEAIEWIEGMK